MKLPWQTEKKHPTATDGAVAEKFARDYLAAQGMRILASNYRSKRGELDIIGEHNGYLVFVEVRLRRNTGFGSGATSVDRKKQQRLALTAEDYLAKHRANNTPPCRFDVISLSRSLDPEAAYHVEWIADAFRPGD